MGMYTQLHFAARLRRDTPPDVVHTLRAMAGDVDHLPTLPSHPLFEEEDRGRVLFILDGGPFTYKNHRRVWSESWDPSRWKVNVTCNLKNYGSEIYYFLDWIHPYIDAQEGDFLGYYRYEETEQPTLIHYHKHKGCMTTPPR